MLLIFKLYTDKLYSLNTHQNHQREFEKATGDIVKVQARTTMQNHLQKIKSCNTGSRAVDILLRGKFDLLEKQIKHYQEVQFKIAEKESEALDRKFERLKKKQIKIMHVLHDTNHHTRAEYLLEIVANFTENVAKLLVNQPIDDDELKVTLCIFQTQYYDVDDYDFEIFELILSKRRVGAESSDYRKIEDKISNLKKEREKIVESLEFQSCLRTIQKLISGKCTQVLDVRLMMPLQNITKESG